MRTTTAMIFSFLLLGTAPLVAHATDQSPEPQTALTAAEGPTAEAQDLWAPGEATLSGGTAAPEPAPLPAGLQEPEWMRKGPGSQIADCGTGPPNCPPGCHCVEVAGQKRCYC